MRNAFILLFILTMPGWARAGSALDFDGNDDHVSMGEAPSLGLSEFTVECWFRWIGEGDAADTGSGGVDAYPLVAKGRGESDGGTQDMNYFLGVRESDGVLTADFEDLADGTNHPVAGIAPVTDGAWHHAAVTYDGDTWTLYLDGMADATLSTGGATPRHDSAQHFSVGTAMNTNGTASGRFRGAIDEVRVWSAALTVDELWETLNDEISQPQTALVSRWGFDDGSGTEAADSVGDAPGTVTGASWAGEAPFDANRPPDTPQQVAPGDGEADTSLSPGLQVSVTDADGDDLTVRFYGREAATDTSPFTIVALPDTQYYSCACNGGSAEYFVDQTAWIVEQRVARNIAFVTHLGDIVDSGDSDEYEWENADAAMTLLEDPATTGLTDGVPYGLAVGNHDQGGGDGLDASTELYNQYFGIDRFEGRLYYGGHHGDDNDNHYILFSAGGLDFVALFLEFEASTDEDYMAWASDVLTEHADRRAIVTSHYLLSTSGSHSTQGLVIYESLKHHPNLVLMITGHLTGEAWRADTFEGNTVYTMLADYQFWDNGGEGWLRVLEFSPTLDQIQVSTYTPTLDQYETDADSEFVLPYNMSLAGFELLAEVTASGRGTAGRGTAGRGTASATWSDLAPFTDHEWYVEVSDGRTVTGEIWAFTTGDGLGDDDDDTGDDDGDDDGTPEDDDSAGAEGGCSCRLTRDSGAASGVLLAALVLWIGRSRR